MSDERRGEDRWKIKYVVYAIITLYILGVSPIQLEVQQLKRDLAFEKLANDMLIREHKQKDMLIEQQRMIILRLQEAE